MQVQPRSKQIEASLQQYHQHQLDPQRQFVKPALRVGPHDILGQFRQLSLFRKELQTVLYFRTANKLENHGFLNEIKQLKFHENISYENLNNVINAYIWKLPLRPGNYKDSSKNDIGFGKTNSNIITQKKAKRGLTKKLKLINIHNLMEGFKVPSHGAVTSESPTMFI
ncbi:hypothetical protein GQX74_014663 [Glossina fuscipes]|nr:hypothetical protein GQX74_014663 [Glossina fuscipes]